MDMTGWHIEKVMMHLKGCFEMEKKKVKNEKCLTIIYSDFFSSFKASHILWLLLFCLVFLDMYSSKPRFFIWSLESEQSVLNSIHWKQKK